MPGDVLAQHFNHSVPSAPPPFGAPDWRTAGRGGGGHNLFAYPAQSNFSGVQHALEWIPQAQEAGWDVLLDAAAFVPTNRLDLSSWHPDYVALSFYKIFGYPTGIGVLLVRRPALAKLRRPWYAGGTLTFSSVHAGRKSHGLGLLPGPAWPGSRTGPWTTWAYPP